MACLILTTGNSLGATTADIIYYNGTILTINDKQPTAEAVAVKDGRIMAVGSRQEVLKTAGNNTKKIDIDNRSGHIGVANSKAIEIAGMTAGTKDSKGGVFRRKEGSQEPGGVLEEYAFFYLVSKLAANFDNDINDALVEEGTELLASF